MDIAATQESIRELQKRERRVRQWVSATDRQICELRKKNKEMLEILQALEEERLSLEASLKPVKFCKAGRGRKKSFSQQVANLVGKLSQEEKEKLLLCLQGI